MSTMIAKYLIPAVALCAPSILFAQEGEPAIPEEKLQEIKAQKVAYLTQKMDLTPEESQKFWPVYNQYDKELEGLRKERREAHKAMKTDTEMTEAEATAAIDRELASQQKELDLRKKYTAEFKKNVGAVKTMKLFRAERDFNRELLGRMRDHHKDGRPGEGRPGGGQQGDRPQR
jgi:Skp family chaperone for outer membrane proteins